MTVWDLVSVAIQRWIVTLSCLLLTGLAIFWAVSVPPVYLAHVRVVLLRPASVGLNAYTNTSQSLVDLAGVVARGIQGGAGSVQTVSEGVTLAGKGVHTGYSVSQPNAGGQWQYSFDQPVLDLQAVDASRPAVEEQILRALAEVEATLKRIQDDQGVAAEDRVRMTLNPSAPQFSDENGSHVRAISATALAGALVTFAALGILGPRRPAAVGRTRKYTRIRKTRAAR